MLFGQVRNAKSDKLPGKAGNQEPKPRQSLALDDVSDNQKFQNFFKPWKEQQSMDSDVVVVDDDDQLNQMMADSKLYDV